MPEFVNNLGQRDGVSARALEFLILTVARSGEVRSILWAEVDLQAQVWTVPAGTDRSVLSERMRSPDNLSPTCPSQPSFIPSDKACPRRISGYTYGRHGNFRGTYPAFHLEAAFI